MSKSEIRDPNFWGKSKRGRCDPLALTFCEPTTTFANEVQQALVLGTNNIVSSFIALRLDSHSVYSKAESLPSQQQQTKMCQRPQVRAIEVMQRDRILDMEDNMLLPLEPVPAISPANPSRTDGEAGVPLSLEWEMFFDDEVGFFYYQNLANGSVTWSPPPTDDYNIILVPDDGTD